MPGIVESLKIITEKASTRIARFAFEHARSDGRKRVTAIHKANIMKLSDGLFLDSARKVSREFTDITYDERIVDAACMQLVMHPRSSTCCCCRISTATSCRTSAPDWSAGSASCRARTSGPRPRVFEAVHGSAPDIADQNLANPTALLLSGADDARAHRRARARPRASAPPSTGCSPQGAVRTRDLGGTASHHEFTDAICREIGG